MLLHKSFEARVRKTTPTSSDLDIINSSLAVEPVEADQLFCGMMNLCNNQYDRSFERFPEGYLKRFADTITGKSVMRGHDYSTEPVGRFYDAEVRKHAEQLDLVPSYYMMADDPLVPKVKAGILKGVSIGFEPDMRVCDLCEKDYDGWWNDMDDDSPCFHIAGREYDGKTATITYGGDVAKVEAVEGSFVWLGCQYGAETIGGNQSIGRHAKSAFFSARQKGGRLIATSGTASTGTATANLSLGIGNTIPAKEHKMDDKEKGGAAPSAEEKAASLRLETAGKAYIERLVKRIETRYAAMEMEDTGKAITAALASADVEALEKAEKDADNLFEKAFQGRTPTESAGDAAAAALAKGGFDPLKYRAEEHI